MEIITKREVTRPAENKDNFLKSFDLLLVKLTNQKGGVEFK